MADRPVSAFERQRGVIRRRRRSQGLERVLGTPALFSTAYGNVGSSIYYALGVTAAPPMTSHGFVRSGSQKIDR